MREPRMIGWSVFRAAVLALLLATLSGCATIFRGNKQTIKMVTDPPGAHVMLDGKPYTTPLTVALKRNKPHVVTITKEGYQGLRFNLMANWDAGGVGAVVADIVIPGGSVLFGIDTFVGADRKFNELATIKLRPAQQPSTAPVLVFERKGHLLTKPEYEQAVAQDSLFAKKGPKDKSGSQPVSVPAESATAQKPAIPSAPSQVPTAGASAVPAIAD